MKLLTKILVSDWNALQGIQVEKNFGSKMMVVVCDSSKIKSSSSGRREITSFLFTTICLPVSKITKKMYGCIFITSAEWVDY